MVSFLSGRLIMWAVVGGSALAIFVAWSTGLVNRGIKLRDNLWRQTVVERVEDVRGVNHELNKRTSRDNATLAEREAEINARWAKHSQEADALENDTNE